MFFDSQQGPSEGSKVGVAESTIAGRGSQNDNVRIVVKSDFTKNDYFISIPMVIIISFFSKKLRLIMVKKMRKDQEPLMTVMLVESSDY